jgi:ABC-type nitrate/sulfonate/bicarbonate transport system substrate-binding protein
MLKKISFVILVVLLIGMLTLNVFAVLTPKEKGEIYAGVEPLETPTKLTIGLLIAANHGLPAWIIEQLGGYEQVGIIPDYALFENGPLMVEALASDSWDCGTWGIGGTFSGVIGQNALILSAAARDQGAHYFFAYPDDPIVKAGKNVSESPLLYGTKKTWQGRDIYLPKGTTLHYVIGKALEKFGLTDKDVNIIHMSPSTGNTVLRSSKGAIVGLWGTLSYTSDLDEKFVRVIQAEDVGAVFATALTANPKSYADPVKRKAIKKWVELYLITVDWIAKNIDEASEYFSEWNEASGIKASPEECKRNILDNMFYTLEENYEMATTMTDDGKMNLFEAINYKPLEFFVSEGYYKPESLEKLLSGNFNSEIVEELYNAKYKK